MQLLHLDFVYDPTQLFIDKLYALKTWGFKPIDLLLAQYFKCNLRDE